MTKITKIFSRSILDSRGNPTLETTVILDNDYIAKASVPSGASKGKYEAQEVGVEKAINIINGAINNLLQGFDISDQQKIDQTLIEADDSDNKKNFGANSILSVSLACLRAQANLRKTGIYKLIQQLTANPAQSETVTPMFNFINGGLHGNRSLSIQEFLIIPKKSFSFTQKIQIGVELYQKLKQELLAKNLSVGIGDEGGFTSDFKDNYEAIDFIVNSFINTKYKLGEDFNLGFDFASSTYFNNDKYYFRHEKGGTADSYLEELVTLTKKYNIFSLEDPLDQDDWPNWRKLNQILGSTVKIIADDLTTTNHDRLKKAIKEKSCNAIIIKVNQIGTVSETLRVVKLAKDNNIDLVVSHRSAETNDDFIADMAVGIGSSFVKFGAPARGERVAKYNRLLAIYQNCCSPPECVS